MSTDRYIWNGKGDGSQQAVGFVRQLGKLSLLKVPNAGHMLPMDQPEVGLAMISQFVTSGSLQSKTAQQGMVGTDVDPLCNVCKADPGANTHFDNIEEEVGVYGVINWVLLFALVLACIAGRVAWRWYKERGAKGDKARGKYGLALDGHPETCIGHPLDPPFETRCVPWNRPPLDLCLRH